MLDAVVDQARRHRLLAKPHFCVHDTLIEAWAPLGHYRRPNDDDRPPSRPPDFKGEARPFKRAQGQSRRLCDIGHVRTDTHHARVVDARDHARDGYGRGAMPGWRCRIAAPTNRMWPAAPTKTMIRIASPKAFARRA
ncbi:MAG: hypothetical protein WBL23_10430 [Salinisphaera sp.]|uniref:hypothetical protein n=1 Tax=Salinisphaera sp. TaxID=1914330 RepID=UPI003C7D36E1